MPVRRRRRGEFDLDDMDLGDDEVVRIILRILAHLIRRLWIMKLLEMLKDLSLNSSQWRLPQKQSKTNFVVS